MFGLLRSWHCFMSKLKHGCLPISIDGMMDGGLLNAGRIHILIDISPGINCELYRSSSFAVLVKALNLTRYILVLGERLLLNCMARFVGSTNSRMQPPNSLQMAEWLWRVTQAFSLLSTTGFLMGFARGGSNPPLVNRFAQSLLLIRQSALSSSSEL